MEKTDFFSEIPTANFIALSEISKSNFLADLKQEEIKDMGGKQRTVTKGGKVDKLLHQ